MGLQLFSVSFVAVQKWLSNHKGRDAFGTTGPGTLSAVLESCGDTTYRIYTITQCIQSLALIIF